MTTPDEHHGEQPPFETFRLGGGIPRVIFSPLLNRAGAAYARSGPADVPAAPPDAD